MGVTWYDFILFCNAMTFCRLYCKMANVGHANGMSYIEGMKTNISSVIMNSEIQRKLPIIDLHQLSSTSLRIILWQYQSITRKHYIENRLWSLLSLLFRPLNT